AWTSALSWSTSAPRPGRVPRTPARARGGAPGHPPHRPAPRAAAGGAAEGGGRGGPGRAGAVRAAAAPVSSAPPPLPALPPPQNCRIREANGPEAFTSHIRQRTGGPGRSGAAGRPVAGRYPALGRVPAVD